MTWGAPAAWIGLAALAVPVLVHLLARRVTTRVAFPTLRFIDPSRLTPTRRRRFTDPWLLVMRLAIIGLAVAALAQPRWSTSARDADAEARITRAIVVDTSASMGGMTSDGSAGLEAARARAEALREGADAVRVLDTDDVAAGLSSAAAWLANYGGTREAIVISDFQRDALDGANIAAVDASVGLRFEPVAVEPPAGEPVAFDLGEFRTTITSTSNDDATAFRWQTEPVGAIDPTVRVMGTPAEAAAAEALRREARRLALPSGRSGGPTTVVLPGAPGLTATVASARGIDEAWMFDAVEAVRRDPAVRDAAHSSADGRNSIDPGTQLLPIVTTPDGRALAWAGAIDTGGARSLLIAIDVDLEHPLTAALLAAIPPAQAAMEPAERDAARIAPATLADWSRTATAVPATAADRRLASDGRWLWLAVIALLALEAWMRRDRPVRSHAVPTNDEVARARVA